MQPRAIILFDGDCGLCAWSIQFIIKHDSSNQFKLVSLQSIPGRRLIDSHNIAIDTLDSIILIEGSRYLVKSSAALRIIQQLSSPWSLISLLTIIPVPIRDWCYDLIARNRHKLFGEVNNCSLLLHGDKKIFLD